tara:strand:- start:18955 stop:19989 length:1035 start_codon:yes stop_codon:yes gene_type:complete
MEPEAQLIAAQAAEELARQQATGTVDEIQRGRMAQQILGGAAQQAKAREAQQSQADFARRKRLGDVVAAGEAQKRIQDYQRGTQRIGGMLQAGLGAASTLAAQGASYLAEQNALAEGLKAAEAEGGAQGAVDFLNANPNYDPGEDTLQRLYAGSEMGQQDAAKRAMEQEALARSVFNAAEARRFEREFNPELGNQAFEGMDMVTPLAADIGSTRLDDSATLGPSGVVSGFDAAVAPTRQRMTPYEQSARAALEMNLKGGDEGLLKLNTFLDKYRSGTATPDDVANYYGNLADLAQKQESLEFILNNATISDDLSTKVARDMQRQQKIYEDLIGTIQAGVRFGGM